ncbi:hypothetical protein ABH920_001401 [Catenulispora sp. EB89]
MGFRGQQCWSAPEPTAGQMTPGAAEQYSK